MVMALVDAPVEAPRRAPGVRPWPGGATFPDSGTPQPCRPLSIPEHEPRCRPVRPTRPGCGTGRSGTRRGAAVRRRRVVLGTVAVALAAALALPWSGTGGHPLATPGSAQVGETVVAHATYVIRPGDTLWSIARQLDPAGDPRPVVAQLSAQLGGDTVVPGERVVLP